MGLNRVIVLAAFFAALLPATATGEDARNPRTYDNCIARYAALSPSPQAAAILKRACFFTYGLNTSYVSAHGISAEQKKLSRTYTPEVCGCLFEKLPGSDPNIPASVVLKTCVEVARKPKPASPR